MKRLPKRATIDTSFSILVLKRVKRFRNVVNIEFLATLQWRLI